MTGSIDVYRNANAKTASARGVVVRVYEAAIAALEEAEASLARGESAPAPLTKAQQLVGGLMTALDFSAGEVANRLLSLYVFVSGRIQETRLDERDAGLGAARRVLETLLAAWREVPADAVRPDGKVAGETASFHLLG
jgi:flagellar protein FliS